MELRDKIIMMALDEITPYENNPRNNEEAVEYVANSIKEFGFNQPIVVDSEKVIIVGHTRYLAAQQLGLTEVPVIVAENLSDEQARAYRLADNKTGEIATWDNPKLIEELANLNGMNMENFGFSNIPEPFEEDEEIPSDFKEYDEDIDTTHKCPKCGYEW